MSSEVKANKLSPATGVTTTLGDASDVFQLPASAEIDIASGATLDVNGTIDVTGATVTGFGGGITDCSLWVLDTSFQGSADPIASNLSEYSGNNYARIGSAMTESSGVFTFPSTGMWWIYARGDWFLDSDSDRGDDIYITTTTDFSTGPTWVNTTLAKTSLFDSGGWTYGNASGWYLFDVTDVAECKVRFKVYVTNSDTYTRRTIVPDGYIETSFMFTRIGDT
jgi:hypothetical protein